MAFCGSCGAQMADGTAFCPKCGTKAVTQAGAAAAPAAAPARRPSQAQAQAYLQDALKALKTIFINPMDGLAEAFSQMDKSRALAVGLTFAVIFEICTLIGGVLQLSRLSSAFGNINIPGYTPPGAGFGAYLKVIIAGAIVFAVVTAALAGARLALRGSQGGIEGDVFIGGAAVVPFGLVVLLSGVLGVGNIEVTLIVAVFALSYFVLLLYAGCTRISGISAKLAAPAVPIIILISAWLGKILGMSMA
ncbi:MAG TPA: zinc ribbon domain-containing protein [Candidatus Angelobacter sp.]|jgi:hypothetical protein|nr:zinc ribbon domain-containing protein [Candidatus Angelobacter sp.]